MPITLDGSVAIESAAPVVTTYPRSYVAYVAGASGLNKFWLPIGQHSTDWNSWESAAVDNWTDSKQALTQPPGNSPAIANKSSAPHVPIGTSVALLPIVAVFTSPSNRTIYFGDSTPANDTTAVADVSSALAVLMVGNGLKGQIAEAHVYNSALSAANVAALVAGSSKPEELAGWVDGFTLKDRAADGVYTSIGGTRQITVDPSKTSAGTSTHPVARAAASAITGGVAMADVEAAGTFAVAAASGAITGNVALDDAVATGTLYMAGTIAVTGTVAMDGTLPTGGLTGSVGATVVSEPIKSSTTRMLMPSATFAHGALLRVSDAYPAAALASVPSGIDGRVTINHASLVAGVDYMLALWNADGTQAGVQKVTAA